MLVLVDLSAYGYETIYKWVQEDVLQGSPHDLRVGRRGRVVVVLFHRGGVGRVVLFPVEHRMLPGKGGVVGLMAIAYCTCRDHYNDQLCLLVTFPWLTCSW